MDHAKFNRYMAGTFVRENSCERSAHKRSEQCGDQTVIEKLANSIDINDTANAEFVAEYSEARQAGLLRDLHILQYINSRRIDAGLSQH